MWKKAHTYLIAIATILSISMFFCRFATIIGPEGENLKIMYYEKIPYVVMLIMLMTGGICAFFSNKQPFLQARICILTALMLIGFQIWLGIDFVRYHNDMVFSLTMMFPLVSAILEIIAARSALVDGFTLQAVKSMKKPRRK